MFHYKLILSYDGTHYFGWQKTKTGPSIQESLEHALRQIARETVLPEAASRTDRGVHAKGQTVSLSLHRDWEPERLLRGLNAVLPPDIRIQKTERASPDFHPTLDAHKKEYHYRLCLGHAQKPMHRLYSWHFQPPLDLPLMRIAARDLLGAHDFTAFANEPEKNPTCHLSSIELIPLEDERLQIAIEGDRFLYKMVRTLVGTLLYVGCGKLPPDSIPSILSSRDRKQAGVTAPAHGLFLHRVEYLSTMVP